MDTGNPEKPEDGRLFPGDEPPLIIEPLKAKRPFRAVKEIEALLAAAQVAFTTELNAAKEAILQAIREEQAAIETMARELSKKAAGTDSR